MFARRFWLSIVFIALAGCSADSYERSADLDAQALIKDRSRSTLDYTPPSEVRNEAQRPATRAAYERIPFSPKPPLLQLGIEPDRAILKWEPLGPSRDTLETTPIDLATFVEQIASRRTWRKPVLGPPGPNEEVRRMDLFACLQYAVQHGRTYQDQLESTYLAALDVTLERHLLSARPNARTSIAYTGGQADVNYRSAYTVTQSVGVKQKLPYGGEVVASALVDFVNAISDSAESGETAQLVLSGSLPLLRGAGLINLEGLISSERELVYQVRSFEEFRRSFAVDIATRYFNLLATQQSVENRRLSVRTFSDLTERTRALHTAGKLGKNGFLEVQRSLQSQLQAEADLITSELAYTALLDDFKIAIGMPVDEPFDVVAVQMDVTIPTATEPDAVATALRYRLTLKTVEDQLADAQRAVANARNSLLPDLTLTAEGRAGNLDNDPASHLNSDTLTYRAGINLDWPVDRLAERNAYRRSLISLERSQRALTLRRDQVTSDVRDALRAIQSAELSVEIQRRGIELARKRLEFSNELLKAGTINARDAVESQNDLLDAQDRYERARSQLQIRVLEFMRDTGTLRVDPTAGALGRALGGDNSEANKPESGR